MLQTSIKSLTTQKMIDEHILPHTFTPPLHTLLSNVRKWLNQLLGIFNHNLHKMKQVLANTSHKNVNWQPVSQWPYPIAMKHYNWVRNGINKLLDAQVICSSHSSWSAPIIVLPKGDGRKCIVIHYRALNKVTWKFVWPMPRVEDIFSKLNSAKYFSTFDLCTGYHHIPLDEDSIPKTAFISPFGKCEYLKVPFGLARHLHNSRNSWIKYWRTYLSLLSTEMILYSTAKLQKNTGTIFSMFSINFTMQNYPVIELFLLYRT